MLAFMATAITTSRQAPAADVPQVDLAKWTPPSIGSVGDDPFGKLVKYGYALFTDTPNQIGPAAADPAKRFSRSSLTCQNCHLKAGTQPYAVPLMGVWGQFPQYRGREGEIGTLEERINGCLERSMNGHVMPLDGLEMKAYLAYMKWLSTGIPDGAKLDRRRYQEHQGAGPRRRPRQRCKGVRGNLCLMPRQGRTWPARRRTAPVIDIRRWSDRTAITTEPA